jgi:hypothetical protein
MPGGAGDYRITHQWLSLKTAIVAGAAAGDHTVTGIRVGTQGKSASNPGDQLIAVWEQDGTTGLLVDRTSEYTISADDTINNTGGTTSVGDFLVVFYADADA